MKDMSHNNRRNKAKEMQQAIQRSAEKGQVDHLRSTAGPISIFNSASSRKQHRAPQSRL